MDIETASELTGESRTKLEWVKSRGLVRTLISEDLITQKNWEEIKDSLQIKYQMQIFIPQLAVSWIFNRQTGNH